MFKDAAEQCNGCENTFSPDMGLGAMLYIVKKKDTAALRSWFGAIDKIGRSTMLCRADGSCQTFPWARLCSKDKGCVIRNSDNSINEPSSKIPLDILGYTSGMCILAPVKDSPDYALMSAVKHISMGPELVKATSDGDVLLAALAAVPVFGPAIGTAATMPAAFRDLAVASGSETHFPLHLEATRTFLRMLINNPDMSAKNLPSLPIDPTFIGPRPDSPENSLSPLVLHERAQIIWQKQKWNPFYQLLADGPSAEIKQNIENLCPQLGIGIPATRKAYNWRWETDNMSEISTDYSNGWDCVFVGKLFNKMRKSANLSEELLALFDKYADPFPLAIGELQSRVEDAKKLMSNAIAVSSASAAALKSARDWVATGFATADAAKRQQLSALQGQIATLSTSAVAMDAQMRGAMSSLANAAPCLPIPDPTWTDPFRTKDDPVCMALKQNLADTIASLNGAITNANNAAALAGQQLQQVTASMQNDLEKFNQAQLELGNKVLEQADAAAVNELKSKPASLDQLSTRLGELTTNYERATGYLKLWRRQKS